MLLLFIDYIQTKAHHCIRMYSDGRFINFSMFKRKDNLIDQQNPMYFFFTFSVDLFTSTGTFLKGFTSTFNSDDGSIYNE